MAVTYQQLLHNVAIRLSALVGTQASLIDTTYNTAVLTASNVKSVDWPLGSMRDAILMAESTFCEVAAAVVDEQGIGCHPWRANISGTLAPLANEALIPVVDSGANKIIGAYGEVTDLNEGTLLTRKPWELIRRITQETWRKHQLYYYCIVGRRIFHTRGNAVIGVCVYNRTTQATAFTANGPMLLPDTAEAGISALAISLCTKDGAYVEQSKEYGGIAAAALQQVARGGIPKAA